MKRSASVGVASRNDAEENRSVTLQCIEFATGQLLSDGCPILHSDRELTQIFSVQALKLVVDVFPKDFEMRKIVLTAAALTAFAAPAFAADLPQRAYAPVKAPVMAAVYDWTGFYIGGNGGYGTSRNCWGVVPAGGVVIPDGCHSQSGGVVGGQVGYRWQAGQFVFGLEAQGDWANMRSSHVSVVNPLLTDSSKVTSLGLFTGQVGYAWNAALLYLKGGAAVTNNNLLQATTFGGVGLNYATSTRWGGAIGVGFEYGFTPSWSAAIEYDRLIMGDANNSFSVPAGAAAVVNRVSQDVDLIAVRVNYKFGGPVVAAY